MEEEKIAAVAAEVEQNRVAYAADVEALRVEIAAELEEARKSHNARIEYEVRQRAKLINRRFGFLFGGGLLVVALLAYRSEINDRNLEEGLRIACEGRAAVTEQYNAVNEIDLPVESCTGEEQP